MADIIIAVLAVLAVAYTVYKLFFSKKKKRLLRRMQ